MAYAAITCLMRTIYQSMELTGCDLQSFYEKLESLRAILEKPWIETNDLEALTSLEAEIAEVTYNAEDMVDSESRNVLFAQDVEERSRAMWELFFILEQAIVCIDSIMKQWMATWDSMKDLKPQTYSLVSVPEHALERPENIMVGHEDGFQMMQKQLVGGKKELEVVSIVGMGGIGKTTLATKLYSDPCIMDHFTFRAKVTVSQDYCAKNVLLGLLSSTSDESYDILADRLQKLLKVKRCLVVIDDIWTTRAWDDIQLCFPERYNGSRILLTTRNVEVAKSASSGKPPYHMRLLNSEESWNLLHRNVFKKDSFPPEFEKVGRQISLKCGGLPLAITVIAGLLSKSGKTLDEWQSVAENVSSVVSTDLEDQCMRVLALSYHHLPSHVKPCFLYFAIFREDELISVDKLKKLWVVEGFLKVEQMRSLEDVAEACLYELIDRSLISVSYSIFDGEIKSCEMHDVIRELCLREARNMNFLNVFEGKSDQHPCAQSMQFSSKSRGRISIYNEEDLARCSNSEAHSIITFGLLRHSMTELPFKLVRVLDLESIWFPSFPSGILHLVHLRYLALCFYPRLKPYLEYDKEVPSSVIDIPPSISSLCYLQNFIIKHPGPYYEWKYPFLFPSEILMMPQLRHLYLDRNYLPYYEPTENSSVLKNLQCLSGLSPRYCTGSFFRLFPNLKKLKVRGIREDFLSRKDLYDFCYLDQLEELEFIVILYIGTFLLESIAPLRFQKIINLNAAVTFMVLPPPDAFPQNLKNLTFNGVFNLPWKDLSIVGKFPKLESLKLSNYAFIGDKWEVAEGGFSRLKFLILHGLGIRYWRADSDHFPCLERLFLKYCNKLNSIPQEFADITTLALIVIDFCQQSVVDSAKQIQQDIQDNYARSIKLHIGRIQ